METPATGATAAGNDGGALTYALLGAVIVLALVFAWSSAFYSNWYAVFRVVHVLVAVLWVGGGALLTILGLVAERKSDPREIVTVARQAAFVGERIFAPAGLVVLAMGIAMMINTNWGWGHFWVTAGLVGFAATFVTGTTVLAPRARRLHELMETAGPTAPETQAAIKQILLIARFDTAVLLLVVVDMVVKPFST
jgi:uncharacterized membrane protein